MSGYRYVAAVMDLHSHRTVCQYTGEDYLQHEPLRRLSGQCRESRIKPAFPKETFTVKNRFGPDGKNGRLLIRQSLLFKTRAKAYRIIAPAILPTITTASSIAADHGVL